MHPQLQPSLAIEVLNSGRNVYIEKSPAKTLGGGAGHSGRPRTGPGRFCQVGFMKRFSEPYVMAKNIASRRSSVDRACTSRAKRAMRRTRPSTIF